MNKGYANYLQSQQWAEIRADLMQVRGEKCERCGKKTKYLHVHHLHYANIFSEEPADLQLLCAKCHMNEHGLLKQKSTKAKKKKWSKKRAIQKLKQKAARLKQQKQKRLIRELNKKFNPKPKKKTVYQKALEHFRKK